MLYADKIAERRNALMPNWPGFVRNPPAELIAEVVERSKADLPNWFVGWAPGVAIASDKLLGEAGYRPGAGRPTGWAPGKNPDVFTKLFRRNNLMVRGAGPFWTIEREIDEALAFEFGPTPLFTRTPEGAMYLAEYCHFRFKSRSWPGLCWVVADWVGIRYCHEPTTWNGWQSWLEESKARAINKLSA